MNARIPPEIKWSITPGGFFENRLSHLTVASLLKSVSEADRSLLPNVTLKSFLNGEFISSEETFPADLSSHPYSLKLTNLQLLVPELQDLCAEYLSVHGEAMYINFYITPNDRAQCFSHHGDLEEIMIYQLSGKKRWVFFRRSEETVRNGPRGYDRKYCDEISPDEEWGITLHPGNWLEIPYGFVHRAVNEDPATPSYHLTFGTTRPVLGNLYDYIIGRWLGLNLTSDALKVLSPHELRELEGLSAEMVTRFTNDFREAHELKKRLVLLQGASYA